MNHVLIALNALALTAVIGLNLMPAQTSVGSLDYKTSMQPNRAVLGEAPQQSATPVAEHTLSF
ncbi:MULTISPECIES: hypothetical protein [unclassified Pseudomonas]|uniref:hypothetical protein n=1 Tax=unclassified Pseudomonas TaxID=196821 RepID=UPI000BA3D0C7|nr:MULTISPECIES: hypothetical protein [unclassified Pseudomonas]MCU1719936.1 hypothetical protein [Pseudomonas sp. 5P_5.1_Bac1]MCU1734158.1 hypothetical protein [Pseudomonas sp. 20P_3.2_Bac4]MCU1742819.1 hypothetical protein [Pseudomonas sp. 20P_3.2_Bac5]